MWITDKSLSESYFRVRVKSEVLPPPLAQHILLADKEVGAQIPGLTLLCIMKGDCLYTHMQKTTHAHR